MVEDEARQGPEERAGGVLNWLKKQLKLIPESVFDTTEEGAFPEPEHEWQDCPLAAMYSELWAIATARVEMLRAGGSPCAWIWTRTRYCFPGCGASYHEPVVSTCWECEYDAQRDYERGKRANKPRCLGLDEKTGRANEKPTKFTHGDDEPECPVCGR